LDTDDSGVASGLIVDKRQHPLIIIYTDNIEQALSTVKQAGGEITQELFNFPGGHRFQFKDPAGNELAFWSE
jgi:glyoxalase family protein